LTSGKVITGTGLGNSFYDIALSPDNGVAYLGVNNTGSIHDYVASLSLQGLWTDTLQAPLTIFPNPTSSDITINLPLEAPAPVSVKVTNGQGRSLLEKSYPSATNRFVETLHLQGNPKGEYLLQITYNKRKITKRIVIR
jgi:hypothetical protein